MEIIVEINQLIKKRLLYIADQVLHGGHWGNSDLLVPEQQVLLDILKKTDYYLCLSLFNCKMLIDWLKEATGYGSFLLQEDVYFIKNFSNAISDFYITLPDNQLYEQKVTETLIISLDGLLYRHNRKNEQSHLVAEHVDLADKQNDGSDNSVFSSSGSNDSNQFRKIITKLNSFLGKHDRYARSINKKELEKKLKNADTVSRAHKKGN